MAEVLGVAAAALQFGDAIWKFKKLCTDVHNVPKELSNLIDEISGLADLLKDLEDNHATQQSTSLADQRAWGRCFQLFQSSAQSIQQLTSQLDAMLKTHRRTGSIRVYLKRQEIIQCRDQLERTKTTMLAAQQSYAFALLTQQNALLLKEVRGIAMDQQEISKAVHKNSYSVGQSGSGAVASQIRVPVMDAQRVEDESKDSLRRRSPSLAFRTDLCLPTWIWRKGLQVIIEQSNKSWGMTFRVYNRLPPGSELYRSARDGDWANVRLLLDSGRASPFDLNYYGNTLLHEAASRLEPDACRFLLSYGLDPFTEANGRISVFTSLSAGLTFKLGHVQQIEIARKGQGIFSLLMNAQPGYHLDAEDPIWLTAMTGYPSETVTLLTSMMSPPYESIEPRIRAEFAMRTSSIDHRTIWKILGADQTLDQAFALLEDSGSKYSHRTLLRSAAHNLGVLHVVDSVDTFRHGWMDVLSQIIAFESRSTSEYQFESSIMDFIFGNGCRLGAAKNRNPGLYLDPNIDDLTDLARTWLRLLNEAGADLIRYGLAEKDFYSRSSHLPYCIVQKRHKISQYIPRYLTYGSLIEDWNIYVIPVEEHPRVYYDGKGVKTCCGPEGDLHGMAGQFWRTIESPELFNIPGTYLAQFEEDCDLSWKPKESIYIRAPCL